MHLWVLQILQNADRPCQIMLLLEKGLISNYLKHDSVKLMHDTHNTTNPIVHKPDDSVLK